MIAPEGHESAQAPHATQSDSAHTSPCDPGAITVSNPLPTIASAKVPWTSSHIRTHLAHDMQSCGSYLR